MKSVTVLTPTVGSEKLVDAVFSVRNQTYSNVTHHLVVDGKEHVARVNKLLLEETGLTKRETVDFLWNNVGANGYYGHRIYAAFGHLINTDYICFLDEDNWYEPNHVEELVKTLDANPELAFAHSLRKIFAPNKQYLRNDDCESLGKWPIWHSYDKTPEEFLIDTSSFCFRREWLIQTGHLWHSGWGGDRRYLAAVAPHCKFDCSRVYSLCYRLDGNAGSVGEQFFKMGNEKMREMYKGSFPWTR